uniref:Uncharacterized protein n=1 Tax=Oryza nivara TaxID=4536 RepID=A0A0E0GX37_ORYNI
MRGEKNLTGLGEPIRLAFNGKTLPVHYEANQPNTICTARLASCFIKPHYQQNGCIDEIAVPCMRQTWELHPRWDNHDATSIS